MIQFKMVNGHLAIHVAGNCEDRQRDGGWWARPEQHRSLIARVDGYSVFFCNLATALQEEIIARTEHEGF